MHHLEVIAEGLVLGKGSSHRLPQVLAVAVAVDWALLAIALQGPPWTQLLVLQVETSSVLRLALDVVEHLHFLMNSPAHARRHSLSFGAHRGTLLLSRATVIVFSPRFQDGDAQGSPLLAMQRRDVLSAVVTIRLLEMSRRVQSVLMSVETCAVFWVLTPPLGMKFNNFPQRLCENSE